MKKKAKELIIGIIVIALIYGTFFIFGITCPIKFLTGISCPGCGMSRAWFSVLRLDFAAAFSYHPLWLIVPVAGIALLILHLKDKKLPFNIILYVCIAIAVVVYIVRMLSSSDIVVFAPQNAFPVRAFKWIYEWISGLNNLT